MAEIVRDLGNRYGDLGSVLVRQDDRFFVVSGTSVWGRPEWIAVPANARGSVTSWRDVCTRDSREAVLCSL